jgi:hypothetical protein
MWDVLSIVQNAAAQSQSEDNLCPIQPVSVTQAVTVTA